LIGERHTPPRAPDRPPPRVLRRIASKKKKDIQNIEGVISILFCSDLFHIVKHFFSHIVARTAASLLCLKRRRLHNDEENYFKRVYVRKKKNGFLFFFKKKKNKPEIINTVIAKRAPLRVDAERRL